jgi:hypothetical protein
MSEEYKKGYRDGFIDGYSFAPTKKQTKVPRYLSESICTKCGMNFEGTIGNFCQDQNCPIQKR